jgi:hypothetical protein
MLRIGIVGLPKCQSSRLRIESAELLQVDKIVRKPVKERPDGGDEFGHIPWGLPIECKSAQVRGDNWENGAGRIYGTGQPPSVHQRVGGEPL